MTIPVDPGAVAARAEALRQRVAAGADPGTVTILAVTKGFGPDAVAAATAAGLCDLGESYAPELATKALAAATGGTGPALRWHFVGRLQSNKVRRLSGIVHLWQSVDRLSVAVELARRTPGAAVLVQVNVSDEAHKGGCEPAGTPGLVAELRVLGLDVRGLMCIGAQGGNEAARPGFRLLRALADDLGLEERSMGMSGDLDAAVEEGSTMVRVGTALFGLRVAGQRQPGQGTGPRSGPARLRH